MLTTRPPKPLTLTGKQQCCSEQLVPSAFSWFRRFALNMRAILPHFSYLVMGLHHLKLVTSGQCLHHKTLLTF
jgi:hypothetical protein